MLISLTEALEYAEKNHCALAAVNTPFFEALLAAIDVAEKRKIPMILQFAQVHENIVGIEQIGPAMVELAKRSEAPFVVHVDHGEDIDYISKGLDIGFNSCMIDASTKPWEENIALTREVVDMAHQRHIGVEAELGVMTGNENGDPDQGIADASLYTDPDQAREFVAATKVDCLAASFGTVHGLYRRKPCLNYQLIEDLTHATGVPLVMHGGSGLSADEYLQSIACGVRKINYYTYAAKAAYEAAAKVVAEDEVFLFGDLARAGRAGAYDDIDTFANLVTVEASKGEK